MVLAKANHLKLLIESHFESDSDRFATVALQVAAHEARQGHGALARDIRSMVDRARATRGKVVELNRELDDLVMVTEPNQHLAELIVPAETERKIDRIIREYRQQHKLEKHGLSNRRKLLLAGPPGTGKTMTAAVLAHELGLPLLTILMDKLMTRFMGETSAKLRLVFEMIDERRGVYLFDEFDAIGTERARENDVGEMRRVLNAFLQLIDSDRSDSLIVSATNSHGVLDKALFRRFDDIIHYQKPGTPEIEKLINNRLTSFKPKRAVWKTVLDKALTLSHAEITRACDDAIKEAILSDEVRVTAGRMCAMLDDRQHAYQELST